MAEFLSMYIFCHASSVALGMAMLVGQTLMFPRVNLVPFTFFSSNKRGFDHF